jgi:hypothetical protein
MNGNRDARMTGLGGVWVTGLEGDGFEAGSSDLRRRVHEVVIARRESEVGLTDILSARTAVIVLR